MNRDPLEPLKDKTVRVKLVAGSYLDAAEGFSDGGRGSKPGSRIPGRNPQLWPYGSYEEFELAVNRLRTVTLPSIIDAFWQTYVRKETPDRRALNRWLVERARLVESEERELLREHDRRKPVQALLRESRDAKCGLRLVVRWMPDAVFVPQDVSEAAGYSTVDALAFARRKRDAA